MKRFLPLLLLTCSFCLGQGEANIWYFGNKAGLDFSTGNPVTLLNGQLNTIEGSSAVCNSSGSILFYTNGKSVWNKNHVVMPNGSGLMGDLSSSQAAAIVKKPGSETIYYIFTTNPFDENGGFRYSVVDMSQADNNGAVTEKNVLLYSPTCEKIAVVQNSNETDYWVVTHGFGNDHFISYRITSSGIDTVPVTTHSGLTVTADDDKANAIGYMKISPDGKKLVACHSFLGKAELFDFNAATGEVSNPILLSNDGTHVYGIEFSTNNKVLYLTAADERKLFQFDLSSDDIAGSKLLLQTFPSTLGALQMGPDGKIYVATAEIDNLSVIKKPDTYGTGCSISVDAIHLQGRMCMLGLPSYNASWFDHNIKAEQSCAGSPTLFTVSSGQPIASVAWDFGDNTTSAENAPSHIYATAGSYTVSATLTNGNCTTYKSVRVNIAAPPVANPISNQVVCAGMSENYTLSQNNPTLLGQQESANMTISYYASAEDSSADINVLADVQALQPAQNYTFYCAIRNIETGCRAITSFSVTTPMQPGAVVPTDYVICENYPYDGQEEFDLNLKTAEILGGQDDSQFTVAYFSSEQDAENAVNQLPQHYTNSQPDQIIYARVQNNSGNCFLVVPMHLVIAQQPKATFISDYVVCDDTVWDGFTSFDLTAKNQEALGDMPASEFNVSYFLSQADAESNSAPITESFTNTINPQAIYARVENIHGGCMVITSFRLIVKECPQQPEVIPFTYPLYITPNGDGNNDLWLVDFKGSELMVINIFDRDGRLVKTMRGNEAWDGTCNGSPMKASDYWFVITGNGKEYRGHFSLIR